jgi:orotate phosphoribosyltransferase
MMTREELAKKITDLALLRGDFLLRSGRKSTYYLDKYRFETNPEVLRELGRLLALKVPAGTNRLAGPELGAVALAASTSMQCNVPFVLVRSKKKEYGTGNTVEGVLNKWDRVVVLEDILTTGGQVLQSVQFLRDAGALVENVIGVIDRLEGARENIEAAGLQLETLFTIKDLGI